MSPSKLLFGVEQKGEITDRVRLVLEKMVQENRDLQTFRDAASRKIQMEQWKNENFYNKKRKPPAKYFDKDLVMIKNVDSSVGVNKKLIPKYKGPYEVKKVLDNDRYLLTDPEGFQLTQIPYNGVVAVDQMKRYIKPR
ncbi:hypothetical protein WN55_09830 [Dufourea novaeangliae]|uniref:Uncharacterized protein n=1 Tax=Dufourea novaeangliae TaxID=178035 RepID=A0A154PT89_DUFNO|nr:hypothetical protein WN55_09830 [Dufourea novaeangliae]